MKQESSTLFFYLPSTTNRSHDINHFKENISLDPIDCPYEDFRWYSETGEDFIPKDFELRDLEKQTKAAEIVRKVFKGATEVSNSNIIGNESNLFTVLQHDGNDITWIGTTKQRVDSGRFKLNY